MPTRCQSRRIFAEMTASHGCPRASNRRAQSYSRDKMTNPAINRGIPGKSGSKSPSTPANNKIQPNTRTGNFILLRSMVFIVDLTCVGSLEIHR